jgi:hypothetical protein
MRRTRGTGALLLGAALALATPHEARAFCGFYVGGAETKLFNNATMVVLMREGTRTVLSMQNNYQGPPADFAMVVPVPVVLQKENVKTLPREVFDHVDALAAPRLVEYWEQDPCPIPDDQDLSKMVVAEGAMEPPAPQAPPAAAKDLGVRIEARFAVGEYEIVILSAQDALGLDTWLHQNNYKIPEGAEPVLRPYVQAGMKFFVAKVDAKKVRFEDGQAMLSPLRFHYDTETFSLPVRLGLLNSSGTQDLIVHILAKGKRYEVANYPNVTIPTNYDVADGVRDQFGAFYAALFDRTIAMSPGAVVTEYSWDASSCDPCPTPALEPDSIATLGADVLGTAPGFAAPPQKPVIEGDLKIGDVTSGSKIDNAAAVVASYRRDYLSCFAHVMQDGTKVDVDVTAEVARDGSVREVKTAAPKGFSVEVQGCLADTWRKIRFDAPRGGSATVKVDLAFSTRLAPPPPPPPPIAVDPYGFVLTRLHARYTKDALGQDLVFREAPPIEGGREDFGVPKQKHGATTSSINNFQGRYIIRHPWTGPIACDNPRRGVWGGPPSGVAGDPSPKPALKVAFAPRGQIELASLMREDVPELKIAAPSAPPLAVAEPGARGCGSCGVQGSERALLPCSIAALLALLANERRRRRRR